MGTDLEGERGAKGATLGKQKGGQSHETQWRTAGNCAEREELVKGYLGSDERAATRRSFSLCPAPALPCPALLRDLCFNGLDSFGGDQSSSVSGEGEKETSYSLLN